MSNPTLQDVTSRVVAISFARLDASCLDPETISNLLAGRLEPADLARVEAHISRCDDCIDVIAVVAEDLDSEPPPADDPTRVSHEEGDAVPTVVAIPISARTRRALTIAQGFRPRRTSDPPASATESAVAARALAVGTMLGRYEVRRFIGRGGMGDVYEGFDLHLERRVALKVIRDASNTEAARQRLAREARILARLSHPQVVAALDVGLDAQHVFLVMELIEGPTLAQWLRGKPQNWRDILKMFIDAGEGLAAAHAVGIVHRDFKPQNVLIGVDGKARVSDFGLARSGRAAGGEGDVTSSDVDAGRPPDDPNAAPSAAGALIGTPRYMAPEQILGLPIDARADQFSFCVALHEALFGVHPFAMGDAAFANASSATSSMPPGRSNLDIPKSALLANRPSTPSGRTPVPRSISASLERGLASEPALRFDSMRELLTELRRRGRPRQRRATLTVAAALACVTIASGVAALALRPPSDHGLTPTGEPVDWSRTSAFYTVPNQIFCVDALDERRIRVAWGEPRQVDDVDVLSGRRQAADLVADSYRHGCPQLSPDGRKLIFEGYDSMRRPHIFYATNPRGEGAQPIVSCAAPTHRSEPLWLSSSDFVFDMDLLHPAVYSLDGNRTSIVPDSGRPQLSVTGFFKGVSRDGKRIAVVQAVGNRSAMKIFVYKWPGLDLDYHLMANTEGAVWRFGIDHTRLYGWTTTSSDDWIVQYDHEKKTLANFARVNGRHASDVLELSPVRSVLTSRRVQSLVRFVDPAGKEHDVPMGVQHLDGSPSMTPSGDVLFVREFERKLSVWRWSTAIRQLAQLTAGPRDWPVAALSDTEFLVGRPMRGEGSGLYRCWVGSTSANDCKVIKEPFAGMNMSTSPGGEWAAYVEPAPSGGSLQLLRVSTGETVVLSRNSSACEAIWTASHRLWAALREGDSFTWTEFDPEARSSTGRSFPAAGGCFSWNSDPTPPIPRAAWTVQSHEYDIRLIQTKAGPAHGVKM